MLEELIEDMLEDVDSVCELELLRLLELEDALDSDDVELLIWDNYSILRNNLRGQWCLFVRFVKDISLAH